MSQSEYVAFDVQTSSGAPDLDAAGMRDQQSGERGGDDLNAEPSRGVDATEGDVGGGTHTPTHPGAPPFGSFRGWGARPRFRVCRVLGAGVFFGGHHHHIQNSFFRVTKVSVFNMQRINL